MTTVPEHVARLLPLPAATFHILMALRSEDLHGYAIMRDVEERTGGELRLSAGTLYRTIHRLLEQGLIEELRDPPRPEGDDERRRYYRLAALGVEVARAEARRLTGLVAMARDLDLVPGES